MCVCSTHSTSVPTPWLECVHASVHVFIPLLVQHLGYTHTDLYSYRHVYPHHVKSGLHAVNIRVNKNTSYFFVSQKRNDAQFGAERSPWNGGSTSKQRSHLQMEVSPLIRSETSNWRYWLVHTWQLKLIVIPPLSVISNEYNALKHNGSLEVCTTVYQWKKHEHNIYLSLCTGSVQQIKYEYIFSIP